MGLDVAHDRGSAQWQINERTYSARVPRVSYARRSDLDAAEVRLPIRIRAAPGAAT